MMTTTREITRRDDQQTGEMTVRDLTMDEIAAVNGGVWGVVAGVAAGALVFLAAAAEEAYLANQTAWYAAR